MIEIPILKINTIISFDQKNIDHLMNRYNTLLHEPLRNGVRNAHLQVFYLFGYSQFIIFAFVAFIFYIGSKFIINYADN